MNINKSEYRPADMGNHRKMAAFVRTLSGEEAGAIIGGAYLTPGEVQKQGPNIVDEDDCSFPGKGGQLLV